MTDILPPAGWLNVRQLETNEFASGGANGNMNEQAKSLAARSELLKQYAALPYESKTSGYALNERVQLATGDIVRSTIASNVNNPNENMTGWVNVGNLVVVNTVAELVAKNLKNSDVVKTLGYNSLFDDGGAIYVISNTATNYSIPLSNGKHAVFNDSFDIRKFGIVSSKTLRQDENLLRMRNYADSRSYTIDFLGFDIVTPNSNAGINPIARESVANGLWFDYAHHYKNLNIYNDKSERLETGKCLLIFCPSANPSQLTTVIFENINLDPWNDNYQPFTEDYLGAYDGMRHGIFIHPKGGFNSISKSSDKYRCLNFVFKFININFLSSAYSYNITQAGVRAREVHVDGLYGEALLGINLDTYDYFANNTRGVIRQDLIETNREMVESYHHFEPELSGQGDFNRGAISLNNCHSTIKLKGTGEIKQGQTLWISDLTKTTTESVNISESSGTFEFQKGGITGSVYNSIIVDSCRKYEGVPTWISFNDKASALSVDVLNTDFERIRSNSDYSPICNSGSLINSIDFINCNFPSGQIWYDEYSATTLPSGRINNLSLIDCKSPVVKETGLICAPYQTSISINGGEYQAGTLIYRATDVPSITLNGVSFKGSGLTNVTMRYTDNTKSTLVDISNVSVAGDLELNTSGKSFINGINFTAMGRLVVAQPQSLVGGFNVGTGVNTNYISNLNGESYSKNVTIDTTISANGTHKLTTVVSSTTKSLVFNLTNVDIIKSVSVSGNTATILLYNPAAIAITLSETVMVKELT